MKSWWMTWMLVGSVAVSSVGAGSHPLWTEAREPSPVSGTGSDAEEQNGPGDCWDIYVQEAIEAYIEYEECMSEEQWWDLIGQAGCAVIYEMRALGAFSWWVTCVGFRS